MIVLWGERLQVTLIYSQQLTVVSCLPSVTVYLWQHQKLTHFTSLRSLLFCNRQYPDSFSSYRNSAIMIRREVSAKKMVEKMALLCKGTDSCTEVKRCSLRIRVEYLCSMLPITLAQFHTKIFHLTHPISWGGGTAIYGLYRYVPLWRVWFSSNLL